MCGEMENMRLCVWGDGKYENMRLCVWGDGKYETVFVYMIQCYIIPMGYIL